MERAVVMSIILGMGCLGMGCGPVVAVDDTTTGSSGSEGTTTTTSTVTTTTSTVTTTISTVTTGAPGDDDASGSSGLAPAECGDGIVGAGEACDDGNLDDLDGCDAQCRLPGTELWETTLPEFSDCPRLAALDDGAVAAAGNDLPEPGVRIPQIVVIDADGSTRWAVQGGHSSDDWLTDAVAEPGGFVVVGRGSAGLPSGTTGWMQRWTADGTMTAEAILGEDDPGNEIFLIERRDATTYWIIASDDDDAGRPRGLLSRSFEQPPEAAMALYAGAFDVLLASVPNGSVYVAADASFESSLNHFGPEGDALWTLQYDAPADYNAYNSAIATTSTGDVIVAGTDQGVPDVQWIRRFNPDGTELWRTNVAVGTDPSLDHPNEIAVDAADNVVVVGEQWIEGGNAGFVAKYDGDGVERWQETWTADGELNVRPCDVVTSSGGAIVVAGTDFVGGQSPDMHWLRAFTP